MEEQTKYQSIDFSVGAYDAKNEPVRQMVLDVFICPSYAGAESPISCYAACHHDVEAPIDADNHGVFFLNSHIAYDDLHDGAGYTLFFGEKLTNSSTDLGWLTGTSATLRNTSATCTLPGPPRGRGRL